jgi:hypothetical protein
MSNLWFSETTSARIVFLMSINFYDFKGRHKNCTLNIIGYDRFPHSAASLQPFLSLDQHDLFVPRTRTTLAQARSFLTIGPALWNSLTSSLRVSIPSRSFPTSLSSKPISSLGVLALGALLNGHCY